MEKKYRLWDFEHLKLVSERVGNNPQTGEQLVIPARNTVKFKAGMALKEKVERRDELD